MTSKKKRTRRNPWARTSTDALEIAWQTLQSEIEDSQSQYGDADYDEDEIEAMLAEADSIKAELTTRPDSIHYKR